MCMQARQGHALGGQARRGLRVGGDIEHQGSDAGQVPVGQLIGLFDAGLVGPVDKTGPNDDQRAQNPDQQPGLQLGQALGLGGCHHKAWSWGMK